MSDSTSSLPVRPSVEQLRKQAKELLRACRAGDITAAERFASHIPGAQAKIDAEGATLADAQFVIARELGFENWAALMHSVRDTQLRREHLSVLRQMSEDLVRAVAGDEQALTDLSKLYGRSLRLEGLKQQMTEQMEALSDSPGISSEFTIAEAQMIIARQYGFGSWSKMIEATAQPQDDPRSARLGMSSTPPFYKIDWRKNTIELRPPLSGKDWDAVFDVIREFGITGLNAGGQMTDAAMIGLSKLDGLTNLNLEGSARLSDAGLLKLARMPHLQELNLSGWESPITDRGLVVLQDLPELKRFQMCWAQRISDAGASNLRFCETIAGVDLLGTRTGNGAISALRGKTRLRHLKTGKLVTDSGLELLHEIPVFKRWLGGRVQFSLMSPDAEPNHLLLDGPFTDAGLATIAGLQGLFALSLFWHVSELSPDGLGVLKQLPNLGFLGCEGELCNSTAMTNIAAIPRLRMLMAQGTVAGDDGFAALSGSRTLEYIWGRECPNLRSRGFAALAEMPALRGLAVSCKNVDDAALSTLSRFPSLRELMPMDVTDDGFIHVGDCRELEALWCMYCRDTGDAATEHLSGLSRLKSYYAGATKITDRSLEILGRIESLERIEFHHCRGISNEGMAHLERLPRLRELIVGGSPRVTRDGVSIFPSHVHVDYW